MLVLITLLKFELQNYWICDQFILFFSSCLLLENIQAQFFRELVNFFFIFLDSVKRGILFGYILAFTLF